MWPIWLTVSLPSFPVVLIVNQLPYFPKAIPSPGHTLANMVELISGVRCHSTMRWYSSWTQSLFLGLTHCTRGFSANSIIESHSLSHLPSIVFTLVHQMFENTAYHQWAGSIFLIRVSSDTL
jgi:hypothetical protein